MTSDRPDSEQPPAAPPRPTARSAGAIEVEVVIIGGGVMGASAAYHLARAGVRDVVLLEAHELASGSSGKPLGGVRAQFSDPANVELGLRSLRAFHSFEADLGVDIGFREVGYLFAIRDPADVAPFEASVAVQHELGVPSRMVGAAEAGERCPLLSTEDVVAAAWSPTDGFARPLDTVRGLAAAAAALGATVRTGAAVVGIDGSAGRALVTTADGTRYATPTVICTAGAWSSRLAAMAGVDLPIEPVRRQIAFTEPVDAGYARVPFTIDYSTTAYFHGAADGGLLLGWADPSQPAGFDRSVTDDWHEPLRAALREFAPTIADIRIVDGWAGLYEMTPDCNALIGEAQPGFRFLYAAGFSGHGFLQGPAVGECLRDLYLQRPPVVDVSAFDARRFAVPASRTELAII
jgi:sarcosine oxidase subunit beta